MHYQGSQSVSQSGRQRLNRTNLSLLRADECLSTCSLVDARRLFKAENFVETEHTSNLSHGVTHHNTLAYLYYYCYASIYV